MADTEDKRRKPKGDGSTHVLPPGAVLTVTLEFLDEGAEPGLLRATVQQSDEQGHAVGSKRAVQATETRPALSAELDAAIARVVEQKLDLLLPEIVSKVAERLALAEQEPVDEGDLRSVLSFRGEGSHVEVPNPFDDPTSFTIALWARPSGFDGGGARGLVGKPGDKLRMPGLWLSPGDKALHYSSFATTGQRYEESLEGFFEDDAWVHVAWVKRERTYEFYRNGELVASQPAPKAVFSAGADYCIGRCDDAWRGQLAEVSVWSVARSPEEIAADMHGCPADDAPGLAGYWPLDEGSGSTATDKSVNGNHGAIVGATWARAALYVSAPAEPATDLVQPAMLVVADIHNVGVEPGEGDEYVEIANRGGSLADLSFYRLHASGADRSFVFPEDTVLDGGESVRVYTNLVDPETGGFSFDSPEALWDNQGGDAAVLFDSAGRRVGEYRLRRRSPGG